MAQPANDFAEDGAEIEAQPAIEVAEPSDWDIDEEGDFEIEGAPLGENLALIAIGTAALGWAGFVGWSALQSLNGGIPTLEALASWIAIAAAPLALLGIVWLLVRQSSAREARRFGRTAQSMRAETMRLDKAMRIVRGQLTEARKAVSEETDRLMALGDEAAGRLSGISGEMTEASRTIEEKSEKLDSAAKSAREDIAVLLADLPRAEEMARAVGTDLRNAGVEAHEQAVSLDAQLSALSERGREANELAGGAAKRLAAHLSQIEGIVEIAAKRFDETGVSVRETIDQSLGHGSEAVEQIRRTIDETAATLGALVENARVSMDDAGREASEGLIARIDGARSTLDTLEEKLTAQREAADIVFGHIDERSGQSGQRLQEFGESNDSRITALCEHIETLEERMGALGSQIGDNESAADRLIARAGDIGTALEEAAGPLGERLPEGFDAIESRAIAAREAMAVLGPQVDAVGETLATVVGYVETSGQGLAEQREGIDRFVEDFGERIAAIREAIDRFESAIVSSDERARSITDAAAPQLIEALMQVRETADQAAERARKAFGEVIPASAAALGEATRQAMSDALGEEVEQRIEAISTSSERALEAARQAGERLTRQLEEISATSAAIEERAELAKVEIGEADQASLARSVILLIESLNSIAIDVTKILSNEVTDTEWASYLKGDRGIFARRAVRLLDSGEAREIAAQYDNDGEFREQVNRYIHDFEAMIRQVLATRGGSSMAVTLLSSDNGKLYVALAQAIDRLRSS